MDKPVLFKLDVEFHFPSSTWSNTPTLQHLQSERPVKKKRRVELEPSSRTPQEVNYISEEEWEEEFLSDEAAAARRGLAEKHQGGGYTPFPAWVSFTFSEDTFSALWSDFLVCFKVLSEVWTEAERDWRIRLDQ